MRGGLPWMLGALVALVFATPVVWTWQTLREKSARNQEERLRLVANQAALRLEEFFDSRMIAVQVVQQGVATGLLDDRTFFETQSAAVQQEFGGFQALNWVDASYTIRWVVPLQGNEGAVGRSVMENPVAREALLGAEESRKPCLTQPVDLFQGGRGCAAYFPVFTREPEGSRLIGFVNAVFRLNEMVGEAMDEAFRQEYAFTIMDGSQAVYASPDLEDTPEAVAAATAATEALSGTASFPVLDRRWTLRLWPRNAAVGWLGADSHLSLLIGGLSFSLALGLLSAIFVIRRREYALAERERRQLELRHAQAHKMEAVGQLAGSIAHDFNNLLTSITGSASLAQGDLPPANPAGRHLQLILEACQRAKEMTGRLLAFSRAGRVEEGRCDAAAELKSLHGLLKTFIREDIELDYRIDEVLGTIALSGTEWSQVVINLVSNAMDALPDGGKISLRAQAVATEAGRRLRLSVLDGGVGMSAEALARAYEPFFSTKQLGRGTGLGLATVDGLVRRAGGEVQLRSELGAGTEVTVLLPISEEEAPQATDAMPQVAAASEGQARVLVVEDEEAVCQVTCALLERANHQVVAAKDGAAAQLLFEQGLLVDLVLCDVVMPRLGGLELARWLRADGFPGAIILCSGYAADISPEEMESLQLAFLAKPFDRKELLAMVAAQLLRFPPSLAVAQA